MNTSSFTFRLIALVGLLTFVAVQFFLIYNNYQISEEHFFSKEKELIDNEYSKSIVNDRIFPGGLPIIDHIYYRERDTLEKLYYSDKKAFKQQSQIMVDSIFTGLIRNNNLDSVLNSIIKIKYKIANDYKYAIVISKFDISFKRSQYIQLYPYISGSKSIERIGGTLSILNPNNCVTSLTVSSIADKSNRIGFKLYIEPANKIWGILKKMMPMFLLSLASIIIIVSLFAITINNWLKQKKLAEMQTDFINSISHEFNTPLTAIIIANKTLQNDKMVPQSEILKSITDIIQRQTSRLDALFKQTLQTTKTNQSFLNKQEEHINQLVKKIVDDYKINIHENTTIDLHSNVQKGTTVSLDTFWFTTMLQNLMDNGIKYNSNTQKRIEISLEQLDHALLLHVKDNGIGMEKKTIKKTFQKFYRHNEKSTKAGGLGLGLFYVQECVRLHGWDINVESNIGIGSEFIVTLCKK
ncbi:MAG: HAMP domain-containing sensor histidine kinase [Chitinophagaceae bacterium]